MNKYFLLVILSISFNIAKAQTKPVVIEDSVKNYLDSSLTIIEKNALNSNKVNWKVLKENVYAKASGAKTYEDILPLYSYIFEQIDDHHGSLNYKNKSYGWKGNDVRQPNPVIDSATGKYKAIRSQKIGNDIGYILIPGNRDFRGRYTDSISNVIKLTLAKVQGKDIKGWIVDLRVNTGGNMYPMIAGLSNLLGEGKVGGFVTYDGKASGSWVVNEGAFYVDSIKASAVSYNGYPIQSDIPVAVLIGRNTASSGEMTAITFIGRKNSTLIGEPSGGYTTVNSGFILNDYSGLNLAVDFAADRNGTVYPKRLFPNIEVVGRDDFENLENDAKVIQAISFISGSANH